MLPRSPEVDIDIVAVRVDGQRIELTVMICANGCEVEVTVPLLDYIPGTP